MTTLGKYELHEQLGKGGFGTVYRATDTSLGREVAIKVLHPQLMVDETFVERFKKEARVLAAFDHPNIVTIHDMGEVDGRVFIAMKYLSGGNLQARIQKEGGLPFEEAKRIMGQVCEGLQVAHEQGMVHRDLKPANILFDSRGNAVISDFGLAKIVQMSGASSSMGVVGTPAYRAPELWIGKPPASPATDVYSLGCVFSEMLTGKVLFKGDTTEEILASHLNLGPSLPEVYPAGVPSKVRELIERAVEKETTERYQTAFEFEQALADAEEVVQAVDQKPQPKPRVSEPLPVEIPAIPEKTEDGSGDSNPKPEGNKKSKPGVWLAAGGGLALILLLTIGGVNGWFDPKTTTTFPIITEAPNNTSEPIITLIQTEDLALAAGSTKVSQIDGMTMVYVPAGEFTMGSPDGVGGSDEHPQHQVYLDAFWIDQTEVTNAMYEKCVNNGRCTEPSSNSSYARNSYYGNSQYADYPVIYVDWNQAQDYCVWAGRQLPTEAQWEKAARGTGGSIYPWGNGAPDKSLANFNGTIGDTTEVGSYPEGASPYGALDMAGNVWEWVADLYDEFYYYDSPFSNPEGTSAGGYRCLRGASWDSYGDSYGNTVRSADRDWSETSYSGRSFGFRCALPLR